MGIRKDITLCEFGEESSLLGAAASVDRCGSTGHYETDGKWRRA